MQFIIVILKKTLLAFLTCYSHSQVNYARGFPAVEVELRPGVIVPERAKVQQVSTLAN